MSTAEFRDGHETRGLPLSLEIPGSAEALTPDDKFQAVVTDLLSTFRQSVERVIYSVTKSLSSSRSLLNAVGIDLKTSYQIFKLLGPVETLATVQYFPAAVSFKKLLAAAKKHGAPESVLSEAMTAYETLERYISNTTGDFEAFETAVMSYADSSESSQVSLAHRKAAFKADVYFNGVSVDTLAMAFFFHPSAGTSDTFDFLSLRQMMGLRRLRSGTDVLVERIRLSQQPTDTQSPGASYLSTAFDEVAAAAHDAAVIPAFCSQPLLPLTTTVEASGDVRTLLKHRDLGVGKLVDVTTGRVHRGASLQRSPAGDPMFSGLIEIARPTRLQIVDFFIHRPTWPNLTPRSGIFGHYLPRRSASTVDQDGIRLPFSEALTRIDRQDALRVPEVPRHTELLRHACQSMGWRLDEMDAFRFRIEYPLMDSNIQCVVESLPA